MKRRMEARKSDLNLFENVSQEKKKMHLYKIIENKKKLNFCDGEKYFFYLYIF